MQIRTEVACRLHLKAGIGRVSWDSTLLKLGSVHMESPVADIYSGHFLDTLQNQTKLGSV